MITLWGRSTSANVQKPMWLIGELGLDVERKDVGGAFGGLDTPEYKAMNPHSLIPTLQDKGYTVWESEAVLRYIGAEYGTQFWPDEAGPRAEIDQWMSWVQSSWSPAMTNVFINYVRVAKADRDAVQLKGLEDKLFALATLVDGILATRQYLAGDKMSLADFAFATFLYRYYTLEIDRPDLPNLAKYYEALSQSPAYQEHVQISYAGMRVPGAEAAE